jgi:flagellar hook-associated protein 2
MASTAGVNLAISGLASGFDWQTMISQLAQAERSPESAWLKGQTKVNNQNSAFTIIKSYLSQFQADVQSLKNSAIYDNRSATSSAGTVATASSQSGGLTGTFNFNVLQLATAASQTGSSGVGSYISPTGDVNSVTVGAANFATSVTAGNFSVNGAQVSIATTDSLKSVFDKIAAATGNTVTASYDNTTDKITLSSAGTITLGSAADTSNFLQVAKLYNNNSGTIASSDQLGRVSLDSTLGSADFKTSVSDGGSGTGEFKINGVSINFNASTDTTQTLLDRINSSAAGVSASYDVVNNRFMLANKTTGDVGIALADVTGNFLAASGLSGGSFSQGKNLTYSINDGMTLVSQSNTIGEDSSGIAGLSVKALTEGKTTVTVGTDTSSIVSALQKFVEHYNSVQSYITSNSATTTSSSGTVSAGTLVGDMDAARLATRLRSNVFSPVSISGLSDTYSLLANLGITSNGYNNTVTLDSTKLNDVLANHLGDVKTLFSDTTNGLAVKLDTFLTNTIGDSGTLTAHQTALSSKSKAVDTQIANLEKQIAADSAFWTKQFRDMETAQSKLSQELSYLNKQFGSTSSG